MNRKIVKNFETEEETIHSEFSESLKNQAGYILITCSQPAKSGEMKVEMSYGGNSDLVNMLLDGAQEMLGDKTEEDESITEVIPF